jgi:hypothetical protein
VSVLLRQAGQRSGSDWFEGILRDAQFPERVLPVGVRVEVDAETVSPPQHLGGRDCCLRATLSSPRAHHSEGERLITEVEERLGFDEKFISPYVLELSLEPPKPIVPLVDAAANCRKHRVDLDFRIAERDPRLYIARAVRLHNPAVEVNVLLRHRPRSIPQAQESA